MDLLQHQSPDTPIPANESNETSAVSNDTFNDHLSEGSEYLDDAIRMVEQPFKTRQQKRQD